MKKEIGIPEGYEAKIVGNKVVLEPKESEDERIRKALIQFLTDIKGISESGRTTWSVRREDAEMCNGFLIYLEKQKEQKPVKLNDDTELGLDYALQIVKGAKGNLDGYQTDDGIYECDQAIQTLERILKNGIEQKPIFKEGDKVIWQGEEFNILDVNEDSYNVGGYILPFYRQKELSLVEQKPAEWSEEDEHIIEYLIDLVNSAHKEPCTKGLLAIGAESWLKSLRPQPHWKPSDEQMGALDNLASVFSPKNKEYETVMKHVKTLRDDLKKL